MSAIVVAYSCCSVLAGLYLRLSSGFLPRYEMAQDELDLAANACCSRLFGWMAGWTRQTFQVQDRGHDLQMVRVSAGWQLVILRPIKWDGKDRAHTHTNKHLFLRRPMSMHSHTPPLLVGFPGSLVHTLVLGPPGCPAPQSSSSTRPHHHIQLLASCWSRFPVCCSFDGLSWRTKQDYETWHHMAPVLAHQQKSSCTSTNHRRKKRSEGLAGLRGPGQPQRASKYGFFQ